jgi:ABC-type sugar transport system ATPase subunit
VLEVRNLSVAYGGLRALTDVSLSVAEGRFVTIVGPNGAGKSTLFKTICGVVPPVSGTITFGGENLLSRRPSDRAHLGIAHVPEGRQVFKTLTVRENLEMGAYPKAGRAQWTQTLDRIHTLFPILAERRRLLVGRASCLLAGAAYSLADISVLFSMQRPIALASPGQDIDQGERIPRRLRCDTGDQPSRFGLMLREISMAVANHFLRGFTKTEARQLEGLLGRMFENAQADVQRVIA